jgi:hypothetical protein
MGRTKKELSKSELSDKTIFNNRFVVELCENVHLHYRNLRINLSMGDFVEIAKGCSQALERWQKRGCPQTGKGRHVELCRKVVGKDTLNDGIKVNLNYNLYPQHKGSIFAEGANFEDKEYIHLKVRDLRLEMSKKEFEVLANAVEEAKQNIDNSALLQKT